MTKLLQLTMIAATVAGFGQESVAADTGQTGTVEQVVVTATRRPEGVPVLKSPAPIDVIQGAALQDSGFSDISQALEFQDPSVNFNRAATTATAASTRPVTLRGLSPDQVLVLVNGKRRHASSILDTNNTIGRGSAPVDLDTIPEAAIQRVEILRDGAAAQYGSDAIAGVVNIILRSDDSGEYVAAQGGITGEGDGASGMLTGRAGFDLGGRGNLTLTGEITHQDPTNRANIDQRFGHVTYWIGDPRVTNVNLAVDSNYSIGTSGHLYFFGTASYRRAQSPSGYRTPATSPALYPDGYVANINPRITDFGLTFGYRTDFGDGWNFDLSHTVGFDRASFTVTNTANLSLGASSPTNFYAGAVAYREHTSDALLNKHFGDVLAGLEFAAGAEQRLEFYNITTGGPDAYFGAGADGFPGFDPRNPVDKSRSAYAGFVDLELDVFDNLNLGFAARYDNYSDFGGAPTWKGSARYAPTDWLAFRGTASTGFRAPSMQQQYFDAITNNLAANGTLTTVGTLPVSDPIAKALGATPLKPERSHNYSAGVVLTPLENFSLTADIFRIVIKDRIALSEQLAGADVTNILNSAGITNFQQVRFFTNALDTRTEGLEINSHYTTGFADRGILIFDLGYGRYDTNVERLKTNSVLPSLPLLGAKSLNFIAYGQPSSKVTLGATAEYHPLAFSVNATRFGSFYGDDLVIDQKFGAKCLVDLTLNVALSDRFSLLGGIKNVGDVYPDQPAANSVAGAVAAGLDPASAAATVRAIVGATGGSFPSVEEAPFGYEGRSYFIRLEARL